MPGKYTGILRSGHRYSTTLVTVCNPICAKRLHRHPALYPAPARLNRHYRGTPTAVSVFVTLCASIRHFFGLGHSTLVTVLRAFLFVSVFPWFFSITAVSLVLCVFCGSCLGIAASPVQECLSYMSRKDITAVGILKTAVLPV